MDAKLLWHLKSMDAAWLMHRLRTALGLRGPVPRPLMSLSRFDAPATAHAAPRGQTRLKVLVFSHNLSREGAPISLKELIGGLTRNGELTAEVVAFEDGPLRTEYESLGISVQVLPEFLYKLSTLRRLKTEVERLAILIRASGADVILANTLLNFPAILAAEEAGIPSVWNPRESEPWPLYFQFLPDPVAQQAIAAMSLPRKVVFVAEATKAVWKEFEAQSRFTVIHNALNLARFSADLSGNKALARQALGWEKDECIFLCTGTVCDRKGQEDAVLALECISGQLHSRIRLVLAGDSSNPYAVRLKQRALQWATPEKIRVDFLDATDDIGRCYLAADAFLLCSRVESYPRVILEALAFGLPIIATPIFGVAEQLPQPGDALFYAPADIAHLSDHLLKIANHPDARQQLSEQSVRALRRLPSFDEMCQRYRDVLHEAVNPPTIA